MKIILSVCPSLLSKLSLVHILTGSQRDRDGQRERDRVGQRVRDRDGLRERERDRVRQRERETETDTGQRVETETDRERETGRIKRQNYLILASYLNVFEEKI